MTPRTSHCEVFWALLSSSKHLGVPEDSKSSLFPSVGLNPTLGQSRVATANEDEVGYSFLSDARNEFHCHEQDLAIHLFNDRCNRGLFVKGTDNDRSIIWNQNALALWAKVADHMHALLFLLMHFTAGDLTHGEEYRSYFLRNTEHSDKTFFGRPAPS